MANEKAQLALLKTDVVDVVTNRIREFQENGEIHFPKNYSPENALKSAWLILQDIKDKDDNLALVCCTKDSIANALLDMVVQGLNPAKKQCYFIPYGKNLVCQRSYFGTVHVIKTVKPDVKEVFSEVVYENDEFEYEKQRGRTIIVKHKQKIENVNKEKIVAAYATILYKDGSEESMIMTFEEIKQAWRKSRTKPIDDKGNVKASSTHGQFPQEMAKKTVINRLCKMAINSSDDSSLIIRRVRTSAGDQKTIEVEKEIAENANQEPLDISTKVDMETGEILEADYREVGDDDTDNTYGNMSDDEIQAMLDAEAELMGYDF